MYLSPAKASGSLASFPVMNSTVEIRIAFPHQDAAKVGVAREQHAAATRPVFAGRIGAVTCPVLVITGDADAVIAPAASEELAAALPQARLVRLDLYRLS